MMFFEETVEGLPFSDSLLFDLCALGERSAVFDGFMRGGGDKFEDFVGYLSSELGNEFEDFHGLFRYRAIVYNIMND